MRQLARCFRWSAFLSLVVVLCGCEQDGQFYDESADEEAQQDNEEFAEAEGLNNPGQDMPVVKVEAGSIQVAEAAPRKSGALSTETVEESKRNDVEIVWTGLSDSRIKTKKALEFTVNNWGEVNPARRSIALRINCHGLLDKDAALDLGTYEFMPNTGRKFKVDVSALPLQSFSNVVVLGIDAEITDFSLTDQAGLEPHMTRYSSDGVYCLHTEDYQKAAVFGEEVLKKELEGKTFEIPLSKQKETYPLGRMKKSERSDFTDVLSTEGSYIATDSSGKKLYQNTGESMSEVVVDENGMEWEINPATGQRVAVPIEADSIHAKAEVVGNSGRAGEPPPEQFSANFCARLKVRYDDSNLTVGGFGPGGPAEDIFNNTTWAYHNVPYAKYYVEWYNSSGNWYTAKSGYLNSDGCTGDLFINSNSYSWRFSISTYFYRSDDRRIYVVNSGVTDDDNWSTYQRYNKYFTVDPPNAALGTVYGNFGADSFSWNMFVTLVASRFMDYGNTLGIPDNYSIKLKKPSVAKCIEIGDQGSFEGIHLSDGCAHRKFTIGHEMGHAIGKAKNYHLGGDGDYYNTDPRYICNCSNVTGPLGTEWYDHCFNSIEKIKVAQSEGWAHFISEAAFNNRSGDDGIFTYYKDVKRLWQGSVRIYPYPYRVVTSNSSGPLYPQHMLNNCIVSLHYDDPDNSDNREWGDEWDWLHFFWNLWHFGPNQLDIDEIREIWPRDSENPEDEDYQWGNCTSGDKICYTADSYLNDAEFVNFKSKGHSARVDMGW